jgi:adenylate cyclase
MSAVRGRTERQDGSRRVRIRYYEADDSIFADEVYLIKGLAGRILWLLLSLYSTLGRSTFSNRELRLDPFLKLPTGKNNLEARLLLLQRRLEAKTAAFRLSRQQRGHVRVLCSVRLELEVINPE